MIFRSLVAFPAILIACGCTTMKTTNTVRTGTEQLLISTAVDRALSQVDFTPLANSKVYVEEKYLDGVDKNYVAASVRHRVTRDGGHLVGKPEEADVIMELRSGAIGTDNQDAFLGSPQIGIPGMISLPEVKLVTRSQQSGIAKVGIFLYDAKTRNPLGEGGVVTAQSTDRNWFVLGVGPYQDGTLRRDLEQATEYRSETPLPTHVVFDRPNTRHDPEKEIQNVGHSAEPGSSKLE